jgi:hypothetical protein
MLKFEYDNKKTLVGQVVFGTDYPNKIEVAKKQKAKYYTVKNTPQKYLKNPDRYTYNDDGYLVDMVTKTKVIKNRNAGKPRYWNVNFQHIWNQSVARVQRAQYTHKLEECVREDFKKQLSKITKFPICTELVIRDMEMSTDVHNKGVIYHKIFNDLLKELNIIPDDNSSYVNEAGKTIFVPVTDSSWVGMEFNIYHNEVKLKQVIHTKSLTNGKPKPKPLHRKEK